MNLTETLEWLERQAQDALQRRDRTELGTKTWRWWDGRYQAFRDTIRVLEQG